MKAAVVTRFGPPEVLKIQELPIPEPEEGHLLVKVKAIGLNFADVFARMGVYPGIPNPPFVPGLEISGIIHKVGARVSRFKRGDRVLAFTRLGAYAEYVSVDVGHAVAMPKKMSFEEAAAIGVAYLTAYHGLIRLANIQKGEKLLIHAAGGGVGIATIQIAKHLGAEVFGTAGSETKLEVARAQGLDHAINYRTQSFDRVIRDATNGYGIDVIMDSVGGALFRKGWKLLAPMGRYVLFGFAAVTGKKTVNRVKALKEIAAYPVIFPPFVVSRNLGFFGFNLFFLMHKVEYLKQAVAQVLKWYGQKVIKPVIGAKFPFDEITKAQEFLQSRKSYGKVVVTV